MFYAEYPSHLYLILYPNSALVLSQLSPLDFVARYNYGSASFHAGKLVFAEVDIDYRHPYFRIDEALKTFHAHADGSPKATKYVSSYRVLEHVDIDAIQVLYLANADGTSYALHSRPYEPAQSENLLRVYAEIDPVRMLTLSRLNLRDFGKWFTDPQNIIAVPRLLYLQVTLDVPAFLSDFERNPFIPPPLEGVHPSKLRDAILDLKRREHKLFKGLTLETSFTKESYRRIRHGFMFMDQHQEKFFPMPSLKEIENTNLRFYRGM
jgi:hypothetical protein